MLSDKGSIGTAVAPTTYSFGENHEQPIAQHAMALVALSHTIPEQQLYSAMLAEISSVGTRVASLTTRRLMSLTGINGYSTVRRALNGLVNKLSIERQKVAGDNGRHPMVYLVFTPEEIIERRRAIGLSAYPKGVESEHGTSSLARAIRRVVDLRSLSRREAQVALCCAQGLTNAEIGTRLQVSEQTVKFHLRNIFVKFGVKRRAELVSRLFRDGEVTDNGLKFV
ncbi:MAG TPA: helix-turn-helix transcriptional regulator [Pyrinomonadaceae bacterium]|nr:helix-turn-helix transcriptional regulator [Pyrinomonadaceae bacterium]